MRARYPALLAWGVAALLLAAWPPAHAQPTAAAFEPSFDAEVVVVRADDGAARFDVYAEVPYSSLRFLARSAGFEATYTVTAQMRRLDDEGRPTGATVSRAWDREVVVPDYDATLSADAADRSVQAIGVEPGRYALEVTLEDGASGRTFTQSRLASVRDLSGPVALGDPVLLDAYDPATGRFEPNVGGAISTEQEAFTLFYEVYADEAAALQVTYAITERNRVGDRPSFGALLGLARAQRAEVGVPLVTSEPLDVPAGRSPAALRVETGDLQVGEYTATVRLETPDGELVDEAEREFSVRWMGLDSQISDLDAAISQLRYVAKDREIAALREAPDENERLRLFREFWSRRDPTPGTPRNEQMEAYYYRVSYANERYSRMRDAGWNTDRGEVFIRFGQPDAVEEHPFSYGSKPYEVWRYFRHGRMFIFVDEGVGDYRLVVPIWDERTRM